jgi:hypothetical protein
MLPAVHQTADATSSWLTADATSSSPTADATSSWLTADATCKSTTWYARLQQSALWNAFYPNCSIYIECDFFTNNKDVLIEEVKIIHYYYGMFGTNYLHIQWH